MPEIPGNSPERRLAFRRLQDTFVRGLADRAREIEHARGGDLEIALHRLAGAAGVLRFEALSRSAREGELALRADVAQTAAVAAGVLALIRQTIAGADTDR